MHIKTFIFVLAVCLFSVGQVLALEVCYHEPDSLCFDATCAQPVTDKHAGKACMCNDDNIGEMMTECNSTTNTRKVVYFWRPPATCLGGTLPEPVDGVPCDLSCGSGKRIDLNTMSCTNCSNGTFSVADGHSWYNWVEWPAQFSTYCAIGDQSLTCNSWRLLGEYTDSGNNYDVDYMQSVMELRVHLVKAGQLYFEFKVSAEAGYDGLYFVTDNLAWWFISNTDWRSYTFNLDAGYHIIQWIYSKDYFVTRGEDRASVRAVRITGLNYGVTNCEECPPGHYQDQQGQTTCKNCPANTHASGVGSATCDPCNSWEYSFPGAVDCITKRACNSQTADYSFETSPCVSGTQQVGYYWVTPVACNTQNQTLPSNTTKSCSAQTCSTGTEPSNGQCQFCNSGYASDGTKACTQCKAGTAASQRVRTFSDWGVSGFPSGTGNWTTGCTGDCFSNGWRSGSWFIDSGLANGANSQSYLKFDVFMYKGSSINFTFALQCTGDSQFVFSVNDFVYETFSCNGCATNYTTVNYALFYRNDWDGYYRAYHFKWTYIKGASNAYISTDCDRVSITSMTLSGVAYGLAGSPQCVTCSAGYFSDTDGSELCSPCGSGQTSNSDGKSCVWCTGNTISDRSASPSCLTCGGATKANSDHTACSFNCSAITFTDTSNGAVTTYDLSAIRGERALPYNGNTIVFDVCMKTTVCDGYSCYKTNFTTYELGHIPDFSELPGRNGLVLKYLHGVRYNGTECSTIVTVLCDPGQVTSNPFLVNMNTFTTSCQTNINWYSVHGCPICLPSDYGYTESDCSDSLKKRTYYWKNNRCWGGATLPATEYIACKAEVSFYWRTVAIAVTISVVGGIAAISAVVFLYLRHRKLQAAYSALKNTAVPLEDTN